MRKFDETTYALFWEALAKTDWHSKPQYVFYPDNYADLFSVKMVKMVVDYSEMEGFAVPVALVQPHKPVRHFVRVPTNTIPDDDVEALDFFVKLILKGYLQFESHELMEGFLVDKKRIIDPHLYNSKYRSDRSLGNISVYGADNSWRNEVMWEACELVMRPRAPDFRSYPKRLADTIGEWELKTFNELVFWFNLTVYHVGFYCVAVKSNMKSILALISANLTGKVFNRSSK